MTYGNVLITGGAGFIGSQLIKKILPYCRRIDVIDNLSTGRLDAIPQSSKIRVFTDTITNRCLLEKLLPDIDYIFHLACSNLIKSVGDIEGDYDTNLYGGYILLQSAHSICRDLKRIVYTSTASIYGNAAVLPTTEDYYQITFPYSASKLAVELYCSVYHHLYKLPFSVVRLSNVYGPGQSTLNPYCGVIAKFFEAIMCKNPLVIYGDGKQTRDFTYIEDALEALMITAGQNDAIGKIYNVGTEIETSINDLADKVNKITAIQAVVKHAPKRAEIGRAHV